MGYQGRRKARPLRVILNNWKMVVSMGYQGRRKAQYISLKHLLRDLRGERIEYFDKVEKSILWLKGFGRRYIAFLGFVLVVNGDQSRTGAEPGHDLSKNARRRIEL